MTQIETFRTVMSLGVDCRVRFQIARHFEALKAIPPSETVEHENTLVESFGTTHLFDYYMVWFHQVISCFEARFERLFAKEDLRPSQNDPMLPEDRFGLKYSHMFKPAPGQNFAEMIEAQYARKSKIVLFLRDRMVEHMRGEGPTLFVRCQGHAHEAEQFCAVVRGTYPSHRFHLLLVDMQDETTGFTAREADFSIYRMNSRVRKAPSAAWTGDDDEWSDMFRLFAQA